MSAADDLLVFRYLAEELSPDELAEFESRLLDDEELAIALSENVQVLAALQPAGAIGPGHKQRPESVSRQATSLIPTAARRFAMQACVIAAVFACGMLLGRWTGPGGSSPEIVGKSIVTDRDLFADTTATLRESGAEIATAWLHLQEQPFDEADGLVAAGGFSDNADFDQALLAADPPHDEMAVPHVPAWLIAAVQSDGLRDDTQPGAAVSEEGEAL